MVFIKENIPLHVRRQRVKNNYILNLDKDEEVKQFKKNAK